MSDFIETAIPTAEGVEQSLIILRQKDVPFAENELANRLDLLFLPFLKDIPTANGRVARLRTALELAADRLPDQERIVYEAVFLKPVKGIERRLSLASDEINRLYKPEKPVQSSAARRHMEKALERVPSILLDPDFAAQLDYEKPLDQKRRVTKASKLPKVAFEYDAYECSLDIDDDDPRRQTEHRLIHVRAAVPEQRVISIRYYTYRQPPMPIEDGIAVLSKDHTYLGTLPDMSPGSSSGWYGHFIHLGRRMEIDDKVTVETREEYFDEQARDRFPNLTFQARFPTVKSAVLAVRLPKKRAQGTQAEARVIQHPHTIENIVDRWPVSITSDGWARFEFTKLEEGLQYGIFFPHFDLYN